MALVKKFDRITKERNSVHAEVDCTYSVFTASDGKRYLQLDTFGSKQRKILSKTSQSIQFDPASALELKRILEKEIL